MNELATDIAKIAAAALGVPAPTIEAIEKIAAEVKKLLQERITEVGDLKGNVIE